MFAIFLHEDMQPFYDNVTSFPTVIFSFFLIMAILFWCTTMLGLIDIDFLDFHHDVGDFVGDHGTFDAHSSANHHDLSHANSIGGLLLKFGLDGVPVTVIISLLAVIGWFVSYYIVHFTFGYLPFEWLRYVAGIPVFAASLYVAIKVTAVLIKPLKPLFKQINQEPLHKQVLGQVAVVRSSKITQDFGEAVLDDGGAGLLLKVRCGDKDEGKFKKGDAVVLLEYQENSNAYRVISEEEFTGG